MCGIAGFSHTTDITRRMAPHLLWDIESRGKDSWGATDGLDIVRVLGPVTNTYVDNRDIIEGWERTIFHTRGASTGEVTVENQHPFYFVEGEENTPGWKRSIMGIHNGIVNNHSELNRKYSRNFSVDSMHIFKHLVERRSVTELTGWGNLAWYEFTPKTPEGILHLCRFNADALHIAKLDSGELVFCSFAESITRAARMAGTSVKKFFHTDQEYVYTFIHVDNEWQVFKSHKKLTFGGRTAVYGGNQNESWTAWENRNRGRNSSYAQNFTTRRMEDVGKNICAVSGCTGVVEHSRKTSLICKECLVKVRVSIGMLDIPVVVG